MRVIAEEFSPAQPAGPAISSGGSRTLNPPFPPTACAGADFPEYDPRDRTFGLTVGTTTVQVAGISNHAWIAGAWCPACGRTS